MFPIDSPVYVIKIIKTKRAVPFYKKVICFILKSNYYKYSINIKKVFIKYLKKGKFFMILNKILNLCRKSNAAEIKQIYFLLDLLQIFILSASLIKSSRKSG